MTPICSCGRPLRLVETRDRKSITFWLACVGIRSCGNKSATYSVPAEQLTPELIDEMPFRILRHDRNLQIQPVSGEVCLTRSA